MRITTNHLANDLQVRDSKRFNPPVTLTSNEDNLLKASQEFEAIFMQSVFKSMRASVPKSGLFNQSNGEEIFRSMLDSEYAKVLAGQGSLGIGLTIYNQLNSPESNADSTTNTPIVGPDQLKGKSAE